MVILIGMSLGLCIFLLFTPLNLRNSEAQATAVTLPNAEPPFYWDFYLTSVPAEWSFMFVIGQDVKVSRKCHLVTDKRLCL